MGSRPPQEERPEHYSTVFTNSKAGMEGVDKEKVKQVVFEMSKGSAHFAEQQRRDARTSETIGVLRARAVRLELGPLQSRADRLVAELEGARALDGVWACVDLDAFFASVEELKDPSLKDTPFAVGGLGMISTANYVARKFGVRSAMPGFIGRKLCPQLRFVPGDFESYRKYSALAMQAIAEFDEHCAAKSLDEAFLDLRPWCARHGTPAEEAARRLRLRVTELTGGLTCSVGVAPNRLLAKVCSDINKPNGTYVLPAERHALHEFLATLPMRKLGGIGTVAERVLAEAVGAATCGELVGNDAKPLLYL